MSPHGPLRLLPAKPRPLGTGLALWAGVMESSRSLSPLESGGWPFGTERSSSHPTPNSSGDPLKDLFEQKLKQAGPVGRRNSSAKRTREVDIRNSDPSKRAAERGKSASKKDVHTHKNAHDRESISEPGMPRQISGQEESGQDSELHSEIPINAAPGAPESPADGGLQNGLSSGAFAGLAGQAGGAEEGVPLTGGAGGQNSALPSTQAQAIASSRTAVKAVGPQQASPAAAAVASVQTKPSGQAASKAVGQAAEAQKAPAPEIDMERTASIFRQLRMQLTPATRHATINLVPADLGRIVIHLTVKGGKVSGDIRADKEDTLKILQAHAPELRAALEQSGFEATDFNLSRHGDPSSERSGETTSPLSETFNRKRSGVPEVAPEKALSILQEDRVDTLA